MVPDKMLPLSGLPRCLVNRESRIRVKVCTDLRVLTCREIVLTYVLMHNSGEVNILQVRPKASTADLIVEQVQYLPIVHSISDSRFVATAQMVRVPTPHRMKIKRSGRTILPGLALGLNADRTVGREKELWRGGIASPALALVDACASRCRVRRSSSAFCSSRYR